MKITSIALGLVVTVLACNGPKKNSTLSSGDESDQPAVNETVSESLPVLVVNEEHINDIPLVAKKSEDGNGESGQQHSPGVIDYDLFHASLRQLDYEPEVITDVSMSIIPLHETETVITFNKKDEQKEVVQIVRDGNGEMQQIMIADRRHRDVYNISSGITAKEARQIRRGLKHMVHRGDHYLYDDQSNIMYLLDAKTNKGNEITEAEIDKMEIRAVVWKHKDHHHRKNREDI